MSIRQRNSQIRQVPDFFGVFTDYTSKPIKLTPKQYFTCMWLSVFSICESLYPDANRSKAVSTLRLPDRHINCLFSVTF